MAPRPIPVPGARASNYDPFVDDDFSHVEAIEEDFHGKRDQRVGKHGVKLKARSFFVHVCHFAVRPYQSNQGIILTLKWAVFAENGRSEVR